MEYKDKTLFLEGDVTKFTTTDLLAEFSRIKISEIEFIDLQKVKSIDSAGVAFIDELKFKLKDFSPQLINVAEDINASLETFSAEKMPEPKPAEKANIFVMLGASLYNWLDNFKDAMYLSADIVYWSFIGIFDRKGQRKGSVIQQSILIGVDALGIIGLLSLVLGLILALQSAAQLRQFGANIFVADLIAISMVREMGPMMTAIIVAGRSGSAIASEIATMKVTEEIDALKMMAINPIRYIVVPKFHAITICMPLLVTMATIIGIVGGLIVGITYLDLSVVSFYTEVINVLTLKDVLIGLSKSVFFAWVIVIIGSFYGFKVTGGAEGVGKATTLSVVASIFAVIILDALFSLVFLI